MVRKTKALGKDIDVHLRKSPWYSTLLQVLLVVSQFGLVLGIIFYTYYTKGLLVATKENTDQLKKEFKIFNEPQLYGQFTDKDYFVEYQRKKTKVGGIKKEAVVKTIVEGKLPAKEFLIVENPTSNSAFTISVYVYYSSEDKLYASSDGSNYLKPGAEYVFPLNRVFNPAQLKTSLEELYEPDEYGAVLDSGHLETPAEKPFFVIIYKDLRGNVYLTKTVWYIDPNTKFRHHKKANVYTLTGPSDT